MNDYYLVKLVANLVAERDRLRARVAELEAKLDGERNASQELKTAGAEAVLNALFESLEHGYSLGRVVERFRELGGVRGVGEFERIHCAGGLTVNNALFDQYEAVRAALRPKGDAP